jgi:hypothetical protein
MICTSLTRPEEGICVPYLVQCNQCRASAQITRARDPDSAVQCGCCPQAHHHGQAANACPGGHGPCPTPDHCPVHNAPGPCPGGHCGLGVPGCTVCRPVTITALSGTATLTAATGGQR